MKVGDLSKDDALQVLLLALERDLLPTGDELLDQAVQKISAKRKRNTETKKRVREEGSEDSDEDSTASNSDMTIALSNALAKKKKSIRRKIEESPLEYLSQLPAEVLERIADYLVKSGHLRSLYALKLTSKDMHQKLAVSNFIQTYVRSRGFVHGVLFGKGGYIEYNEPGWTLESPKEEMESRWMEGLRDVFMTSIASKLISHQRKKMLSNDPTRLLAEATDMAKKMMLPWDNTTEVCRSAAEKMENACKTMSFLARSGHTEAYLTQASEMEIAGLSMNASDASPPPTSGFPFMAGISYANAPAKLAFDKVERLFRGGDAFSFAKAFLPISRGAGLFTESPSSSSRYSVVTKKSKGYDLDTIEACNFLNYEIRSRQKLPQKKMYPITAGLVLMTIHTVYLEIQASLDLLCSTYDAWKVVGWNGFDKEENKSLLSFLKVRLLKESIPAREGWSEACGGRSYGLESYQDWWRLVHASLDPRLAWIHDINLSQYATSAGLTSSSSPSSSSRLKGAPGDVSANGYDRNDPGVLIYPGTVIINKYNNDVVSRQTRLHIICDQWKGDMGHIHFMPLSSKIARILTIAARSFTGSTLITSSSTVDLTFVVGDLGRVDGNVRLPQKAFVVASQIRRANFQIESSYQYGSLEREKDIEKVLGTLEGFSYGDLMPYEKDKEGEGATYSHASVDDAGPITDRTIRVYQTLNKWVYLIGTKARRYVISIKWNNSGTFCYYWGIKYPLDDETWKGKINWHIPVPPEALDLTHRLFRAFYQLLTATQSYNLPGFKVYKRRNTITKEDIAYIYDMFHDKNGRLLKETVIDEAAAFLEETLKAASLRRK